MSSTAGHPQQVAAGAPRAAARPPPRAADSGRGPRSAPNCAGLTKIVAATWSARRFASSISARCPAWSAPMVGTSASVPLELGPRPRQFFTRYERFARAPEPPVNFATGGACTCAGGKIKHEPAAFHRLRQRKGRHRQVDDGGPHRRRARRLGPPRRRARPRQPPADDDPLSREPRRDHAPARKEPAAGGLRSARGS